MPKSKITNKKFALKPFRPSKVGWRSPLRVANFSMLFAIVGVLFLVFSNAAPIAGMYGSIENDQVNRINYTRGKNGKGSLQHIECLNTIAENWTKYMALNDFPDANGDGKPEDIAHNPNLASDVDVLCGDSWRGLGVLGENVGVGYGTESIFNTFMASPLHKSNIVDAQKNGYGTPVEYTKVGVGAYWHTDGKLYITQVFANCGNCTNNKNGQNDWKANAKVATDPTSAPAPTPSADYTHYLKDTNSGGTPNYTFRYGSSPYRTVYCDWDGNGTDTPAMYIDGTWYIRNSNTAGAPDITVSFGYKEAAPVCGDWNGDGLDTIGVYDARNGAWSLKNTNTPGGADYAFAYGYSGTTPVAGDWNGDGKDTIGLYINGNWMLKNNNSAGNPDISFAYGDTGYRPVVGDWDGNGTDTIGVYSGEGRWDLRNSNSGGSPYTSFYYGASNYIPVAGDWNNDRVSSIGVVAK